MKELSGKSTLAALGDSITYGYPFTPKESWVEYVCQRSQEEIINAGIPGDTFYDMLKRVEEDVLVFKPSYVIVTAGTNDVMQGFSQPQIQQKFLQLLGKIRQARSEIIIGTPLPVVDSREGALHLWRQFLEEYCKNHNITRIDFYKGFITDAGTIKENLLLDGCHPTKKGYEVMGEIALQGLAGVSAFSTEK